MITNKIFCACGALFAVASLTGGWFVGSSPEPIEPRSRAVWAFETDDPRSLAQFADRIVLAEAVATYPGRIATSANGEDVLPFELTELRVVHTLKGGAPDERIYVERAGGIDPTTNDRVRIDADGGDFELGQRYVLFLKAQPGADTFVLVNDQGRFEVHDGRIAAVPMAQGSIARLLDRKPVTQALTAIREML